MLNTSVHTTRTTYSQLREISKLRPPSGPIPPGYGRFYCTEVLHVKKQWLLNYTRIYRLTSQAHHTNISATHQVLLLPWLRLFDLLLFSPRHPYHHWEDWHSRPTGMHVRIRAGAKSSQVAQFLNTGRFPTYLHRWYSTIYGIYGSGADPARFGGRGG